MVSYKLLLIPSAEGTLSMVDGIYLTNTLAYDGWAIDKREFYPGYYKVLINSFIHHPFSHFLLLVKKTYRLWGFPSNIYRSQFIFSLGQQMFLHKTLICLSLFGIPLSLIFKKKSIIFSVIMLYTTMLYVPIHVEPRYNLPAMPYVIILAAIAFDVLFRAIKTKSKEKL